MPYFRSSYLAVFFVVLITCSACVSIKSVQVDARQTSSAPRSEVRLDARIFSLGIGRDWSEVTVTAHLEFVPVLPFAQVRPTDIELVIRPDQDRSKSSVIYTLPGGGLNVQTCVHRVRATVTARRHGAVDEHSLEHEQNNARQVSVWTNLGPGSHAVTGQSYDAFVSFTCPIGPRTSIVLSIPPPPPTLPDGRSPTYVSATFDSTTIDRADNVVVPGQASESSRARLSNLQILGVGAGTSSALPITARTQIAGQNVSVVGVLCVEGNRADDEDARDTAICIRRPGSVTRP